ncbi:MAG TPA: hypothetical protein VD886_10450, partial [Herpetosiphonaceae bacterium]|nr:hypothetical protein [Herpetosiphonaceae bacterium]
RPRPADRRMSQPFLPLAQAAADDPSLLTLGLALLAGNLVGWGLIWWRRRSRGRRHEPDDQP